MSGSTETYNTEVPLLGRGGVFTVGLHLSDTGLKTNSAGDKS